MEDLYYQFRKFRFYNSLRAIRDTTDSEAENYLWERHTGHWYADELLVEAVRHREALKR